MAEKLHEANIWNPSRRGRKIQKWEGFSLSSIESRRVNIVSEKLCHDVIQRLGPSLERHRGCDLIDINPGVSMWSRALHDAVQPRRHLMLDPSAEEYEPLRKESMGDRKIEIIPKSGIMWSDLKDVMASHIDPHQRRVSPGEQPERNDTLLVTANLATFPSKRLWNFDNIATMVLYQLLSSIRSSGDFQRYGVVRMLIWVNDELKRPMLPRSILGRKRPAFAAELSCDWIHEVAGCDVPGASADRLSVRDQWVHYESAANTLRRMEEQGIVTPPGRETSMLKMVTADPSLLNQPLAGRRPPLVPRAYMAELEAMEAEGVELDDKSEQERLNQLRYRDRRDVKDSAVYLELLQLREAIFKMEPSSAEFAAAKRDFDDRLENISKNMRNEYFLIQDGYHLFRHQAAQTLLWDRRAYEPLAIDLEEFYPNAPICLLDIQPKSMDPVFRQNGPSSNRSGDYSSLMLRALFRSTTSPVYPTATDGLWPGFAEMARDHCPSLWDPALGGSPMSGHGSLKVRAMGETQWTELMKAWMRWPFRPEYLQMLGRSMDSEESDQESDQRGVAEGQTSSE
ncbi:hypothetical protein ACRE_031340 [Hapsidospora chrysogenum ATCC 11550]|uniref:Mitochondrial transcription factor 1 n=1 Tax=Hapsidospora chrysogenum (strain ATCC 11550 / CBS 779.69 / DSM 880 / IAM 14645 / JCM 23072 / IMI 49137) TaxID=857340 RepID=A0A086T9K0_HAPC1|nr:hypothetical protein ACRE_031340 [Hapsidospora chrysogenum ATCC 11550]